MKKIIIYLLLLSSIRSYSQELAVYRDTINKFSIGIPIGWRYGALKNAPSIKLIAQQVQTDSGKLLANYNLNIFNSSASTPKNAYSNYLSSISQLKNFKIVDSSNTIINGTAYKWIIETHQNSQTPISMCNYAFMTYKDGTCYVLTLVAPEAEFNRYKSLFDKVAQSLKL
jgi:hypothetical protein